MNAIETLKLAKEILSQHNLAHGYYAVDEHGLTADPRDDNVCALCSVGAIARALGKDAIGAAHCQAVKYLAKAIGWDEDHGYSISVFQFNDKSTKDEVLAMFDKAIALAEEDERDEQNYAGRKRSSGQSSGRFAARKRD